MANLKSDKYECPYGAESCPKISKVEQMLADNTQQLSALTKDVNSLNTTMKNASYILMIIITLLGGVLGALVF